MEPRKCYIWSVASYGAGNWTIRKKIREIPGTVFDIALENAGDQMDRPREE
jgi:hypothetical protein